jgi:hypothetical protein
MFVLCLCGASLSGIEGARTETKAIEVALEEVKKQQESQTIMEAEEVEDEQEDSIEEGEGLQPGGCTRWCTKVRVGFPIDMEYVKEQTKLKCAKAQCKDCAGGGLTIPDCREKEVVVEPEAEEDQTSDEDDVPQCAENPTDPVNACKLKEGGADLICSHAGTPWCMPPSRNPGHKYRAGSQPLCCDTEEVVSESDMEEGKLTKEVDAISEAFENQRAQEDDPPAPVPLCAPEHKFEVVSFMRKGKKVHQCRDQGTKQFAKNVCCDEKTFQLLAAEEKAIEVCAKAKKFCKPNIQAFENKRKKFKDMPSEFSCKRMYMCCEGSSGPKRDQCFGPVPSQAGCKGDKTGLGKNRPAIATCVSVKK